MNSRALKFSQIDRFIKEYYLQFLNIEFEINYDKNVIYLNSGEKNINFGITIGEKFFLNTDLDKTTLKGFREFTIKLIEYLNENVYIPLSFKLRKLNPTLKEKSVFIFLNDSDLGNLSQNILSIINLSKTIFTNNQEEVKNLLNKIDFTSKNILNLQEIYELDFENTNEIVIFYFGDFLETNYHQLIGVNSFLRQNFDRFFIESCSSNFINNYSLSHTNYGSLSYLGSYDLKSYLEEKGVIKSKIDHFIKYTNLFTNKFTKGNMISLSGCGIGFKSFDVLESFISDTILPDSYLIEIIFYTKGGYYNLVNTSKEIGVITLKDEDNINDINVFIYPKLSDSFLNHYKFNSFSSAKTFTFLSAPLGNVGEFSVKTLEELKKARYIIGESLEGLKNFLNSLNITYFDKELFYGDDIQKLKDFIFENKLMGIEDFTLYSKNFPEIDNLFKNSQKVHFLTDGGTPCILDPGDNVKKHINYNYTEYSILSYKGPSVIPTSLLSNTFDFKYIYWNPFLYTVLPNISYLKEINFFNNTDFKDTLIIFYSFGKEIKQDACNLEKLFDKNTKIQIIGDIGTQREYNKIFLIEDILEEEKDFILNNIDNLVYLLTI